MYSSKLNKITMTNQPKENNKKYFTTKEDFLLAERHFKSLVISINKIAKSCNNIAECKDELDSESLINFENFSSQVSMINDYIKSVSNNNLKFVR